MDASKCMCVGDGGGGGMFWRRVGESVKYEVGWSMITVSNRVDAVQSERN